MHVISKRQRGGYRVQQQPTSTLGAALSMPHLYRADAFAALWQRNRPWLDNLAIAPDVYWANVLTADQLEGIRHAIEAASFWKVKGPSFFAAHPYSWVFCEGSYQFLVEASFQVQVLGLTFPVWYRYKEYGINQGFFGDLRVRQTIVPRVSDAIPRAPRLEGHGLIFMPAGWLDSLNYLIEAARFLKSDDIETTCPLILENACRAFADLSI